MRQDNLRQTLRRSTRDVHDRIEALWAPDNKFATLPEYLAFLEALRDVHNRVGLAAALARGNPMEVDLERDRLRALSDDLDVAPRPQRASRDPMSSEYAWGVGYVLNGSAIGADMILRDRHLEEGWPNCYLKLGRDYVRQGGLQSFFRALGASTLERGDVLRGAVETFEMLDPVAAQA